MHRRKDVLAKPRPFGHGQIRSLIMDKQTQAIEPGVRRRDFLVGAIAGAILPLGSMAWAASSDTSTTQTRSIMKARRLGNMEVSEIGAGAMSISGSYGPPADIDQGIRTLRTAHDNGITFFDTAEVYGPYTNEELVGEALAPVRDQVKIATNSASPSTEPPLGTAGRSASNELRKRH